MLKRKAIMAATSKQWISLGGCNGSAQIINWKQLTVVYTWLCSLLALRAHLFKYSNIVDVPPLCLKSDMLAYLVLFFPIKVISYQGVSVCKAPALSQPPPALPLAPSLWFPEGKQALMQFPLPPGTTPLFCVWKNRPAAARTAITNREPLPDRQGKTQLQAGRKGYGTPAAFFPN